MAKLEEMKGIAWTEIVEFVRAAHNGVMRVDLYFGHDGDNVCRFGDYESTKNGKWLAEGGSGRSMQEAVERCYYEWHLANRSTTATKSGWEEFTKTL